MSKQNLQIDGYCIQAEEGQSVLQAALDAGIYIPHLCYHPDLTPSGNCKLCAVEIVGTDQIVQSCETLVKDGMVINTHSDSVKRLRMTALELLLASHPKDCTSCDKYLHCELQALLQYMGVAHSRLREIEKENTNIQVSDRLIKKEMHRCIQCGRCVKVCEEVRGIGALTINKKNGETYIGTKDDRPLMETDCRFCGACVEVCPTGAIQDIPGIFPATGPRQMTLVPCKNECPAHTDIPLYIRLVNEKRYSEAAAVIREKLTFPLSLGYICSHVCEASCKRSHLNESIAIRETKKFAIKNDQTMSWQKHVKRSANSGKKVAVMGGGAAGLTAAYYLAKKGHLVEVFEKQPMAGGMLSYGIPKYRLPQSVVNDEINILLQEGITLHTGSQIKSIKKLQENKFDAVLVAVGASQGKRPPAYRQQWNNAMDAVDFCRKAIEGTLPEMGDVVTVYGGGNVAFDCARTAKKMGVKKVRVVCMEAREAMMADAEEIEMGHYEGVEILNSQSIAEIKDEGSTVASIAVVSISSFAFTEKGLEMEIIEGSERELETDMLIFATGQQPDFPADSGVDLAGNGTIKINQQMMTSQPGVFAAGDVVYGTKSVVEAVASGRCAAMGIDRYLGGDGSIDEELFQREKNNPSIGTCQNFGQLERISCFQHQEDACSETLRCLQCDLRVDLQKVKYWVDPQFKTVKVVSE
ncbi:FAD-dependent oxidoreductase [Anoxynatronum buryatiense]|uniref:dihydrouracil dehydrogenase (NAD(+)) n=1 Tax=Anoxynatronum buryatiense TaxID=489973 RepID=A0AA46AHU3_9CLOT|nr:FAD-dependent oxidoreductase [Anoxynatronum buryatiense]SMP42887.1 NADPH-dependent glutamate synthase beta chain [Anoxynatronum buryatiense]